MHYRINVNHVPIDPKIEENAPVLEVQKTGKKWDIIRKGMEWQQRLINLSALGNQATEGPDMWTLGTLTDDAYCDSKNDTELRMLKLTTMMNFTLAQDASSLWILIGILQLYINPLIIVI
jgi:hypothetical protein